MTTFIDRNVVTYIGLINAIYNGYNYITVYDDQVLAEQIQAELNNKNTDAVILGWNIKWDGNLYGNKYFTYLDIWDDTYIQVNKGITVSDLLNKIGPYPVKIMKVLLGFIKDKG